MKNTTRILLVLLVCCFLFVACDSAPATKTGGNNAATGAQTGTATVSEESTEEGNFKPVAGLNFGEEDFKILVPVSTAGDWAQYKDFAATELNEEPVNDANFERLQKMKELYNVNVVEVIAPSGTVATDAKNAHNSGDNPYDLIHIQLNQVAVLAQAGYFVDLNSVSSMDLTNP